MTDLARTLPSLISEIASGPDRDRAAIADDTGGRLSYGDLAARAVAFGRGLQAVGVDRGDVVGLLAPNSAEWIVALLGAQIAGACVAAYHTWVKARDLDFLLRHSEPRVLVMAANVGEHDLFEPVSELMPEVGTSRPGAWRSDRFPSLRAIVVIGSAERAPIGVVTGEELVRAGEHRTEPLPECDPDEPGVVLYTSGSTAEPKGVPLQQGAMVRNGFEIGERMRLRKDDKVWLGSPLFWSFGVANALASTFTHQATLVVQNKFNAPAAARQVAAEGCTATYLLPAIAYAFAQVPDIRSYLSTVRTGLTIGRPEEVELVVESLGIHGICNIYGSTETYGNCCVTPCDAPLELRLRSQGPPLPGFEIRILDEATGEAVEAGQPGAVHVRGRITPGYLKSPDLNRQTFTSDGWYRSGDVGVLDSNGWFSFVTRDTDMIKTNGINVSPAEVEEFIATSPDVAQVVVVGAPDLLRDQVIVAFVKPVPGAELAPETVVRRCREQLAAYKVPHAVHLVEDIPLTATGKLSRKLLVEMLHDLEPANGG